MDLDFIKDGFHVGRLISVVVNTEAEHTDTEVLNSDLDYASLWINVSLPLNYIIAFPQFRLPFLSKKY
jgi:hypothetical protein